MPAYQYKHMKLLTKIRLQYNLPRATLLPVQAVRTKFEARPNTEPIMPNAASTTGKVTYNRSVP